MIVALLLASCNNGTPAPETTALNGTVVEGNYTTQDGQVVLQTSAWTGGAGQVTLNVADSSDKLAEVGRTALGADGKFAFATLPAPEAGNLRKITAEEDGCTNTFVVSDPAALNASAVLRVEAQKTGPIRLLNHISAGSGAATLITGTLIYADRAVTVKGSQTCKMNGQTTLVTDVDLTLTKGWNMTTVTGKVQSGAATLRNGTPAGARWIYVNPSTGATGLSLGR